jgi:polyhydroxyalkanoic acid synthase PhaR subunit
MPQTKFLDPLAMWKEIYQKTEATWSDAIQDSMKKEPFSEGLGQTLNNHLQYQELISKMTETYLKQVNMPTRGEIASIASLIINLEGKVDDLQDKIEVETLENETVKEINLMKRSVVNLEKKLDKVLELLEETSGKKTALPVRDK